jgi:hypothetical protein
LATIKKNGGDNKGLRPLTRLDKGAKPCYRSAYYQ